METTQINNNQFLTKKRALHQNVEPKEKINLPKETFDFKKTIDEAFDNFLKGNNDQFLLNLQLLEKNKYSKFNLVI